ncbi:uncharacterized protein I206_100447 [Kwoniella pini CBS 10737]|uniref:Uncharacterized protein n=1 Tax=Kwoniella pini CBS 10737 TaxID=1296096 RepID=A0A1B9IDL0_9TREE|nr:uncharacterized protein I206_00882 [Kwoniella pini CBS 10737]OCF53577.1 hypothetical protein I206_00882 [Kwoniella pini CBS 10737]
MRDLSRLNKQVDQIGDTIRTIKEIEFSLNNMRSALSRIIWKFTGSSVYVTHGELEIQPDDCGFNQDQFDKYRKSFKNGSTNTYYRQYIDRKIDDTISSLPNFTYFSPFYYGSHRSKVKLIDFARSYRPQEEIGPDTGFLEGMDNTMELLTRRMRNLNKERSSIQSEISEMSKAIMARSQFANPFTKAFKLSILSVE